jgi:hypothetical protein
MKQGGISIARESSYHDVWQERATKKVAFLNSTVFPNSSIVALQEYWLHDQYSSQFVESAHQNGFRLQSLRRTGSKTDAVAFVIQKDTFDILGRRDVYLCTQGDRVALILWLRHKHTGKNFIVANTHLSFPHSRFDKMNQVRQMQTLTEAIEVFAEESGITHSTRLIMGDFNVESESPVCDHLRDIGYFSAFEVKPPSWRDPQDPQGKAKDAVPAAVVKETNELTAAAASSSFAEAERTKRAERVEGADCVICEDEEEVCDTLHMQDSNYFAPQFVSHRTHRREDLGVDHIFICPAPGARERSKKMPPSEKVLLSEDQETVVSAGDNDADDYVSSLRQGADEPESLLRGANYYTSEELEHLNNAAIVNGARRGDGSDGTTSAGPDVASQTGAGSHASGGSSSAGARGAVASSSGKKLFVSGSSVLPANLPLDVWDDSFDISDHRPVQCSIVIAESSQPASPAASSTKPSSSSSTRTS